MSATGSRSAAPAPAPAPAPATPVLSLFEDGDPAHPRQRAIDQLVVGQISAFLCSDARAGGAASASRHEDAFRTTELPPAPIPLEQYLEMLFAEVVPHAVRTHSPRFVGHMTSALPSFVEPLARVMTLLNQNVVKLETSSAFTFFERQALAMLHRLIYRRPGWFYDQHAQDRDSTLGMITSGGTLANLTGLWIARNRALGHHPGGPNVDTHGLAEVLAHRGHRRAVVIGSSLMHYSLRKAVDLLGLGDENLVRVQARPDGAIDPGEVRRVLVAQRAAGARVIALVGIGGTTETGQVDPLAELADVAREEDVHFHVDAAWGGPTVFSRTHGHRVAGMERADTLVIDGHKQLYLPMGIGVLLLGDPAAARAVEKSAGYIIRAGSADLGRRTLEGSRPAMAVFLHGALHMVGARGYEQLVDSGIERCAFMAEQVRRRPALELLCEPVLNILVYRYLPARLRRPGPIPPGEQDWINRVNERLQEAQRDAGDHFVSRTTLTHTRYGADTPVVALRAVLANPLTSEQDICDLLDEQVRMGELIERDVSSGSDRRRRGGRS